MADTDEGWNVAAICQALGCPGCPDCREDDSDTTWDGKDAGHFWACPKPDCTEPRSEPGDCPDHWMPLIECDANGRQVNP